MTARTAVVGVALAIVLATAVPASAQQTEGPVVAVRPWTMTADELRLSGLTYHGVVRVPTDGPASKRALKFTASGLVITSLVQTAETAGHTTTLSARPGSVSTIEGDTITLYTERLKGNLMAGPAPVPVDFTPDNPPPLSLPSLRFTNVTVKNAALLGGTLSIGDARLSVH